MKTIGMILLIIIGIIMICFPDFFWKIKNFGSNNKQSNTYALITKIVGIVFVIIGMIFLFIKK